MQNPSPNELQTEEGMIITTFLLLLGAVAAATTTTTTYVGVNKRRVLFFLHGGSTRLSSSSTNNGEWMTKNNQMSSLASSTITKSTQKKEMMLSSTTINNVSCQPLVICGPSGVGKGTIISRFMESQQQHQQQQQQQYKLPEFIFSVSHTTRQPRPGEINGIHYHFVNITYMKELIASQLYFVEHAEVHGNLYGTSFESMFLPPPPPTAADDGGGGLIYERQRQCLLDIDVAGVKSIKNFQLKQRLLLQQQQQQQQQQQSIKLGKEKSTSQYNNLNQGIRNEYDTFSSLSSLSKNNNNSNTIVMTKEGEENSMLLQQYPILDAKFIFITPPSIDTLYTRLLNRNTETSSAVQRRIQNAQSEIDYGLMDTNFDAIIVNDNLDVACDEFRLAVEKLYKSPSLPLSSE
jgi:guanylate kinase